MFDWIKVDPRRKKIRRDRRYIEARARRFLRNYLAADETGKDRFYEAVEGASAACHPGIADSNAADATIAETTAEAALNVVKRRDQRVKGGEEASTVFITDAYATVALAYRRAAGAYSADSEMQRLGTAAVHLLTIATSYKTAQHTMNSSNDEARDLH
ncbi:hypothetical protein [Bradyrhizobium sp. Arg816]|uniref:hypothetical protein n=1 Tax=Bradyrhizobium sp. Arg816 TaxID=2998491 RepID=UPI00249F82AD|nr:hypothetical protein [Bradyrhizobium sp. Arg816]MDI3567531.1 hypothetical protein [Bradyrhizobium sp. Arg816]